MLLTPDEFTRRAVGMPWVRWRADWEACDCWGLLTLACRDVLGFELGGEPRGPVSPADVVGMGWQECAAEVAHAALMGWVSGAPTHCGFVIDGGAAMLHSTAARNGGGQAQVTRMVVMQRLYPDMRFFRRSAPC